MSEGGIYVNGDFILIFYIVIYHWKVRGTLPVPGDGKTSNNSRLDQKKLEKTLLVNGYSWMADGG